MTVTLTRALDALREQMALANERADRAEQLLADERRHVEELRAMLANAMAAERMLADKDATITHLRRQIENLMKLLIDRQPWWKRWFRV
jgi:predicted aminopeptidase